MSVPKNLMQHRLPIPGNPMLCNATCDQAHEAIKVLRAEVQRMEEAIKFDEVVDPADLTREQLLRTIDKNWWCVVRWRPTEYNLLCQDVAAHDGFAVVDHPTREQLLRAISYSECRVIRCCSDVGEYIIVDPHDYDFIKKQAAAEGAD